MSTNAETSTLRLARYVRERRADLDLNQLEVWHAGGPSNTTLTEIENGRLTNLTRTTARKLDAGLRWEPGSARRIWDGGDPIALGAPVSELEELRRRVVESPFLSAEKKREVLATLARDDAEGVGGHDSPAAM